MRARIHPLFIIAEQSSCIPQIFCLLDSPRGSELSDQAGWIRSEFRAARRVFCTYDWISHRCVAAE